MIFLKLFFGVQVKLYLEYFKMFFFLWSGEKQMGQWYFLWWSFLQILLCIIIRLSLFFQFLWSMFQYGVLIGQKFLRMRVFIFIFFILGGSFLVGLIEIMYWLQNFMCFVLMVSFLESFEWRGMSWRKRVFFLMFQLVFIEMFFLVKNWVIKWLFLFFLVR